MYSWRDYNRSNSHFRNPDISEAIVTTPSAGDLRFSVATGFRNIQTIVRKLKTKLRANLPHYIELMACPTGEIQFGSRLVVY